MTDSGVVVPPFRHHRFLGLACGIRIAGQPFKTARAAVVAASIGAN